MSELNSNFFLVIEGLDGSGKTELARRLVQVLQETLESKVKLTFEPYDPSCAGLFIRQVLTHRIPSVSPRTLALAFAANRADHIDREIQPFLAKGDQRIVVCDRYVLSSLVYQSTPTLSVEEVMAFNTGVRKPDLTLFLNASTKTCYERMRRRTEDKELFEKNLNETREKYLSAIAFLQQRGEVIVEIDADGTIDEVLAEVLNALSGAHGPHWLTIQRPLLGNTLPEVFSLNGRPDINIRDLIERYSNYWNQGPIISSDQLRESLNALRVAIITDIAHMSFNELGYLFVEYIVQLGYTLVDRLPWTDLAAFQLEFELPGNIKQQGIALLLGEAQRYDQITKKVLTTLDPVSDFMLVLDPRPSQLVSYYERDIVWHTEGERPSLSPSTRVVDREEIANYLVLTATKRYEDEHFTTFRELPHLARTFRDTVENWQVKQETKQTRN